MSLDNVSQTVTDRLLAASALGGAGLAPKAILPGQVTTWVDPDTSHLLARFHVDNVLRTVDLTTGEQIGNGWATGKLTRLDADIVDYFDLEETSGLDALGFDGTVQGTRPTDAATTVGDIETGTVPYAMGLRKFHDVANSTSRRIDLTRKLTASEVTVAAWVYRTGAGAWQTIFDQGSGHTAAAGMVRLQVTDGNRARAVSFTTSQLGPTASVDFPLNEWAHIAATYGGGFVRLYVNGVEIAVAALGGTLTPNTTLCKIGVTGGNSQPWRGRIADFGLWNRHLTPDEIATLAAGL